MKIIWFTKFNVFGKCLQVIVLICLCCVASMGQKVYMVGGDSTSKVFTYVETLATYPGGQKAMEKFIGENLVYPKKAKRKHSEGKAFVQFSIDVDGTLSDITTIKKLDDACDVEAERIVSLMPKWNPAKQNGKIVKIRYVVGIEFKLPSK